MRHTLTDLALIGLACLFFWAIRCPADGAALLDWAGQQAAQVAKIVRG